MSRSNDRQHPEYRYGYGMSAKSQFPTNAKKGVQPQKPAQVDEPATDPAQREQAMKLMSMLAGKTQEYIPVLKSLKQIGVQPRMMTVMVGDEPTDCIVIPQQELMSKEWAHMSGQDQENS